jgi:hypothetical protein
MAIQIDYDDGTGSQHTKAYARVEWYQVFPRDSRVEVNVSVYHDAAAAASGKVPLVRQGARAVDVDERTDSDGNVLAVASAGYTDFFTEASLSKANMSGLKAAYGFLKTQPVYSSGLDV